MAVCPPFNMAPAQSLVTVNVISVIAQSKLVVENAESLLGHMTQESLHTFWVLFPFHTSHRRAVGVRRAEPSRVRQDGAPVCIPGVQSSPDPLSLASVTFPWKSPPWPCSFKD